MKGLDIFFYKDTKIMYEMACEPRDSCKTDQRSFKAYLSRWMAATMQLAPFTEKYIKPRLRASAEAAAKACSGGEDQNTCGLKWTTGEFDGDEGVGEQMAALEVIQSNLIESVKPPVSNDTGGTSKGNPDAGTGDDDGHKSSANLKTITTGDRAGAGILTVLFVGSVFAGSYWMVIL